MNGESLEVLLELYSELTDKTVITAQNLPKVTFTYRTKSDFTKREATTFYETLMSTRGIAIVEVSAKVVQAIASGDVVKSPPPVTVLRPEELPQGDVYINYVHKLKHVKASETVDLLTAFAKSPQAVQAIESTGTLVLRDFSNNVRAMLAMLEHVDVEQINDQEIAVVKIKYALSADIAQVISSYTANPRSRATSNTRTGSTGGRSPGNVPASTTVQGIRGVRQTIPANGRVFHFTKAIHSSKSGDEAMVIEAQVMDADQRQVRRGFFQLLALLTGLWVLWRQFRVPENRHTLVITGGIAMAYGAVIWACFHERSVHQLFACTLWTLGLAVLAWVTWYFWPTCQACQTEPAKPTEDSPTDEDSSDGTGGASGGAAATAAFAIFLGLQSTLGAQPAADEHQDAPAPLPAPPAEGAGVAPRPAQHCSESG